MAEMEIKKIVVGDDLYTCDVCGYDKGFHTSFKKHEYEHRVILICPDCGQRYDVGWKTQVNT